MTSTVPVPIEFDLPEGWRSAERKGADESSAAYVALRTGVPGTFTPNITVTAELTDEDRSVLKIADESVERLRRTAVNVHMTERRTVASDKAPGVLQTVSMVLPIQGTPVALVQVQAILVLKDEADERRRATYLFALTAPEKDVELLLPDFQSFVGSVRVIEVEGTAQA